MRSGFAPQAKVRFRKKSGVIEIKKVPKELHHSAGNRGTPGFDEPFFLREVWPWEHEVIDDSRYPGYTFLNFVD
jgi:hypothetical protein